MSKSKTLVQIPVGHICLHVQDYNCLRQMLYRLDRENQDLRVESGEFQVQNHDLNRKLTDAESKVSDLEKEVNEKQDRVMCWYQKYTDLADKLNAVKDHAETEEA